MRSVAPNIQSGANMIIGTVTEYVLKVSSIAFAPMQQPGS